MNNLLRDLNSKQREAVTAPLGPVLVLAGAGSGKTRVLTYRIAYLLEEKLFQPEDILALTFTNKAAGEMKERLDKLLGRKMGTPLSGVKPALSAGTFHAVCARLLRQEIEQLRRGYTRDFVIYDTDDTGRLLKQIVLEKGLEERFRHQVFGYYISQAKNRLVHPRDLNLDNEYLEKQLEDVYEIYQERLREHNALDFDDLLYLVCELFLKHPKILQKYQQRFKYVLVDEYQDTNHAQYVMLKALVAAYHPASRSTRVEAGNIFVVGDDAQSIYGFRGANMQNILDFKKDYPKAKVVMLEQNYRSTQAILDTAHKVIALNPFQYEKKLWTDNYGGAKVNLYEARDEMDEAEFVLRRITNSTPTLSPSYQGGDEEGVTYESEETPIFNRFLASQKLQRRPSLILNSNFQIPDNLREQVILYRTHAQSRAFEELLVSSGIPYQIIGGIKFYERKEIKDALSFLRLMANPRDLVSLERVINEPARGIGRAAFKEIAKGLAKYDYNFERLLLNLDKLELADKAAAGAREFFGLYSFDLSRPAATLSSPGEGNSKETLSPGEGRVGERWNMNILEVLDFMLKRSGYRDALLKDGEEGQSRWENIQELFNVAAKFSVKGGPWQESLRGFLEEVALMTDLDRAEDTGNKLTLMTLHSAKGLEFERVFFAGLEEGLLPHSRSMLNPAEIAEEIRLAYVGITRAKKELYLSYARQRQHYGEMKRALPSRIIKAIPKRLLRKLN